MPEITSEGLIKRALGDLLVAHVDAVFTEHRLAYVWNDTDTDPHGKPIQVFVCKCQEGFMGELEGRRKFNEHLKHMLKEV